MDKVITSTQTFSADDVAKVTFYQLTSGRALYIFIAMFIIFAANLLLQAKNITGSEEGDSTTWISALVVMIAFPFLLYRAAKSAAEKKVKTKADYYTNMLYTINGEGLKQEGKNFSTMRYWEDIVKIKETKRWFLIYVNKYQSVVLDKSQMDQWQMEDLKDLFQTLPPKIKVSLK